MHSGAHFGQARTLRLLRHSYFWISMARGARAHCRACLVCQRAKPSRAPNQPMELFGTIDARHEVAVTMDIGALPWGDGDHIYFLLIVDLFSHYIGTVPLKDQKQTPLSERSWRGGYSEDMESQECWPPGLSMSHQ